MWMRGSIRSPGRPPSRASTTWLVERQGQGMTKVKYLLCGVCALVSMSGPGCRSKGPTLPRAAEIPAHPTLDGAFESNTRELCYRPDLTVNVHCLTMIDDIEVLEIHAGSNERLVWVDPTRLVIIAHDNSGLFRSGPAGLLSITSSNVQVPITLLVGFNGRPFSCRVRSIYVTCEPATEVAQSGEGSASSSGGSVRSWVVTGHSLAVGIVGRREVDRDTLNY